MFRLRPQKPVQPAELTIPTTPMASSRVFSVPVEASNVDEYSVSSPGEPTTAARREAELVREYARYLESLGYVVGRKKILPPDESRPLFTDLYNETTGDLIEAKGVATREEIRMGIGQLLDYRRFIEPWPRLILLVPSKPRPDLLLLCSTVEITVVWKNRSVPTWMSSMPSP
jgi:hypothetical protein